MNREWLNINRPVLRFAKGQTALEYLLAAMAIGLFAVTCLFSTVGELDGFMVWLDTLMSAN